MSARNVVSVFALFALTAPSTRACYSGLIVMPTADVVGAKQYSIEYQTDGSLPGRKANTFLINTEVGLGDRAEIGVDFDLSSGVDTNRLFNAKYVLGSDPGGRHSIAVGLFGVGKHLQPSPYIVQSSEMSGGRIHLGLVGIERVGRLMIGYDRSVTERTTLMADYTTGRENSSSFGLNYEVNDRFCTMAGIYVPNNGDDLEFTVHFVLAGQLFR